MPTKSANRTSGHPASPSPRRRRARAFDYRVLDKDPAIIHEQYAILGTVFCSAAHDLSGHCAVFAGEVALSKEILQDASDSAQLQEVSRSLDRIEQAAWSLATRVNILFRQPEIKDPRSALIARPWDLVTLVPKANKSLEVRTTRSSLRTLEILFPHPVLGGIIVELGMNACSAGARNLVLDWNIESFRFSLAIHDDGPGIVKKGKTARYTVQELPGNRGGLSLISGIVSRCHGFISLGTSPRLGGALVQMEIPVSAYSLKGITYAR